MALSDSKSTTVWNFRPRNARDLRNFNHENHNPNFHFYPDETKVEPNLRPEEIEEARVARNRRHSCHLTTIELQQSPKHMPPVWSKRNEMGILEKYQQYLENRRRKRMTLHCTENADDDDEIDEYMKKLRKVWNKPMYVGERKFTTPEQSNDTRHVFSYSKFSTLERPKSAWTGEIGWKAGPWIKYFTEKTGHPLKVCAYALLKVEYEYVYFMVIYKWILVLYVEAYIPVFFRYCDN